MSAIPRWHWRQPSAPLRTAVERGAVLAIPTESSYGLAVDPRRSRAVAAVYRFKGRDRASPLPVVAADAGQLAALGVATDEPPFARLAALWPAPLSLVVPASPGLPAAAGGATLAVRVPAHRHLRALLAELGLALTATSANRSGEPPVLDPEAAAELVAGSDALIVDGGRLPGGLPSTLVEVGERGLTVLRRGRYPISGLRRLAPGLPIDTAPSAR